MSEANVFGDDEKPFAFYIMFLRFCIAYYHAVPMSLYVVYEMLKLILGYQVNVDKNMVYDDEGAVARTADLMEEMGQVDFIFSDKTGTLTANEMVFARGHIDGQDLGDFRKTPTGDEPEGVTNVKSMMAKGDARSEAVAWYFTCLALCHEVLLEVKEGDTASPTSSPSYTGMSPDEVALVTGAQQAGVTFQQRNRLGGGINELEIKDHTGKVIKYEVPELLQFNSDRKRMSVIVQSGGRAWCITKGADSVMEPLIPGGFPGAAKADILKFSKTGLRVLVIAVREIDRSFLQDWIMDYQKARGIFDDTKEAKIKQVVARMEKDLSFVGLTAVEDRLQDGVPDAIKTLKSAGSRLWVLTGDKTETAVEIAYSCALFTETTKLAYCTGCGTEAEAVAGLQRASTELNGAKDAGIVIDGGTLLVALSSQECKNLIFTLGMASQSCICTRLSPMQKLQLVKLVREADDKRITLTIGDGANDVPMILGGHVGVGIRGKEGAAAVQVCDIAISQFRFLVPLLLCHGRRSYRRVAVFFCYYLYKNFVLLMADLVWMFWDNFRGNIAFPEYLSIAFNAFFTSWHVLFVLGFDRDVPDAVACLHPELYKVGPQRKLFNANIFAKWMVYAVLHGAVAWIIPFAMVGTQEYGTPVFWISSTAAFTNVIHVTLLKMVIVAENPFHWITLLPTFGAWFMFVAYLWGIGYTIIGWSMQPNMKFIPENIVTQGDVFVTLILGPVVALFIDLVERLAQRYMYPTDLQKVELEYKAGLKS
jgi:phospholipid-transporting ATPase